MSNPAPPLMCQRTIRVRGIVQGVGFRPAVWRFANELGLAGQVCNDSDGVLIECRGSQHCVDQLIDRLRRTPPPQARISGIDHWPSDGNISADAFVIAPSHVLAGVSTAIAPDLATCPACLAEIRQRHNRRYRYPFTNCTHCGPRLSIVRGVPYDRANSSMDRFRQCAPCLEEYTDPADRRFHAQPNACPQCGPEVWLADRRAQAIDTDDVIQTAQHHLRRGRILALKGIGGFQLVVDACNAGAVAALRDRKRRPHKPFALMARDLSVVRRYCEVDTQRQQLLESAAAPIVILERTESSLEGIAPDQNRLGFMLPTTPLHHLLLADFDTPLVMTSGNPGGAPQCIDNQAALRDLSAIADLFLLHNRDILQRVDDSVVQTVGARVQPLRRARGFAPAPLPLPPGFAACPDIVATGGDLKNTFCLLGAGQALLSQHIGDLQDAATCADFERCLGLYRDIHRHRPTAVAVDQHPQYLAATIGRAIAAERDLRLIDVQHHHAHIAACLGDNLRPLTAAPVLGVALDGLGFAKTEPDHQLWGGEIFIADYSRARRLAGLKPVALAGGNTAMRQPWRSCLAQLHAAVGWHSVARRYAHLPLIKTLSRQPLRTLLAMLDRGINAPLTSSCGRLFDAVAAAVGINIEGSIGYEGQAAMTLEAAIEDADWRSARAYPFARREVDGLLQIDPAPLWPALLDDLEAGHGSGLIAARFHLGLVAALVDCLVVLARQQGTKTVALSGGVFQNPRLLGTLQAQLLQRDFEVLVHRNVPANDGGIALGQGLVAAAQIITGYTGERSCA